MVPHEPSTATLQPALFLKSLSAKRGDGGFYDSHGVRLNFIKKSPTLPPQCKGRNIRGSTLLALINETFHLQDVPHRRFRRSDQNHFICP